jgi:hypothetical protein
VDTFDALLIIRKEENQKIKQYLEDIKNSKLEKYYIKYLKNIIINKVSN